MLTPFAPEMTPKKSRAGEYHGCIYFDPEREPLVIEKEVQVPVQVFHEEEGLRVFWAKPKSKQVLIRDYFPDYLPLSVLLRGREGRVIEVETYPFHPKQSVAYSLLCSQSAVQEGAKFETWYRDSKIFDYRQHCVDYLNTSVPTISRSIARPHFEGAQAETRPKISMKPRVEAEQAKGCTDFKIRVHEDGSYEDMTVDPEALKKYSTFFRAPLNARTMTEKIDGAMIFEINSSIPLMKELVYFLNSDCLNPEITMNTCLGLIGLNSNFGREKQNLIFEEECIAFVQEKLSKDNCERVIQYAQRKAHAELLALVEAFLKREKLNLVGLGIYTFKDCVECYLSSPQLAELIAIGIREELILHGDPKLWKEVFKTAQDYRENNKLFDELYNICLDLAKKNPDIKEIK